MQFILPSTMKRAPQKPTRLELMIYSFIIFKVVILQFFLIGPKSGISKTSGALKTAL